MKVKTENQSQKIGLQLAIMKRKIIFFKKKDVLNIPMVYERNNPTTARRCKKEEHKLYRSQWKKEEVSTNDIKNLFTEVMVENFPCMEKELEN